VQYCLNEGIHMESRGTGASASGDVTKCKLS
jgi:hypothetical protein